MYQTTERLTESVAADEAALQELESVWDKTRTQLRTVASLWDCFHDDLQSKFIEGMQDLKERLTFGTRGKDKEFQLGTENLLMEI